MYIILLALWRKADLSPISLVCQPEGALWVLLLREDQLSIIHLLSLENQDNVNPSRTQLGRMMYSKRTYEVSLFSAIFIKKKRQSYGE